MADRAAAPAAGRVDGPTDPRSVARAAGAALLRQLPVLLPLLVVAGWTLQLASHARGLPDYDYWDMFPSLLGPDGFELGLGAIYQRSNEHIVALTKLFYLGNYLVTDGDNFGLSAIACGFSLVVSYVFARILARHAAGVPERALLAAVTAIAVFTPFAIHNYMIGMSGVAWLGANALMVCAAALLSRADTRRSFGLVLAAAALAVLAGQMYSTGVVALLAIGVQAVLLPRLRGLGLVLLALGMAELLAIYLLQRVPGGHAERTTDLLALATFGLTFLGAGLTLSPPLAMLWGGAGVLALLVLLVRYLTSESGDRAAAAFFIAICAYVLMNGALAAVGRAGMGGDAAAMASRYAGLPSLFWISLLGLALALRSRAAADGAAARHWTIGGATALAAVLAASVLVQGDKRVDGLIKRAEGKRVAALAVWLGVPDEAVLRAHVTSVPSQLLAALPRLRAIGHLPFDETTAACALPGTRIETHEDAAIAGYVDGAEPVGDGWFRVRGWALDHTREQPPLVASGLLLDSAGCLALVDADGAVVGAALGGEGRADVAAAYRRGDVRYGWQGYARVPGREQGGDRVIHAAVKLPDGRWARVPKSFAVP